MKKKIGVLCSLLFLLGNVDKIISDIEKNKKIVLWKVEKELLKEMKNSAIYKRIKEIDGDKETQEAFKFINEIMKIQKPLKSKMLNKEQYKKNLHKQVDFLAKSNKITPIQEKKARIQVNNLTDKKFLEIKKKLEKNIFLNNQIENSNF